MDRRTILKGGLATGIAWSLFGSSDRALAQVAAGDGPATTVDLTQPDQVIDLWPGAAPGMPQNPPVEVINERSTDSRLMDRAVYGITRPRMAVFKPSVPNGSAVMITPGGGYRWVVMDKEGYEIGRWLAARGYTCFVLFYRLPGEGWASGPNVTLMDTQRAMRVIRARATEFGVDPERVAAMGFSAGGHACADLAARFAQTVHQPQDSIDTLSARPMLAAPIYPVISMRAPDAHAGSRTQMLGPNPTQAMEDAHSPHLHIPQDAPPHFILHAEDDASVPVNNALLLRAALVARGIPVETHLFTHGGHGFGLTRAAGKPVEVWPELFLKWARSMGLS